MEKHKKIDTKAIEYHIAGILKALGAATAPARDERETPTPIPP